LRSRKKARPASYPQEVDAEKLISASEERERGGRKALRGRSGRSFERLTADEQRRGTSSLLASARDEKEKESGYLRAFTGLDSGKKEGGTRGALWTGEGILRPDHFLSGTPSEGRGPLPSARCQDAGEGMAVAVIGLPRAARNGGSPTSAHIRSGKRGPALIAFPITGNSLRLACPLSRNRT